MQWPVLCLGPVCVPLNLLLPFLVGVAHRAGWLSWCKREWVTMRYWRSCFSSTQENGQTQLRKATDQQEGPPPTQSAASKAGCTVDREEPSSEPHDAARASPPSGIHRRGQQVHSVGGQKQQPGQQDIVHGQ